jgi:hypothetical protein
MENFYLLGIKIYVLVTECPKNNIQLDLTKGLQFLRKIQKMHSPLEND